VRAPWTVDALNALGREEFAAAVGWVFEHSPWVAERAWASRPFADVDALHRAMVAQVAAASKEEQLALLGAHPDLATRARVSEASAAEQAGVGLDRLTPEEFSRFEEWNRAYRDKFGYPFLFAVKGSTKHLILRALGERLASPKEQEFQEALRQVYRIARFRLEDAVGTGG